MSFNKSKHLLTLIFVLFPLYMIFTFDHSLWNPDETRDAGIARSMYVDRDFVVPRLNGEAFLEKPPLYYWSCSLIYAVTGRITAGTTRLPAALFGFLGVLFTFLLGRRFFGNRTGLLAGLMLALSAQYFRMSHFALMDSSLAALITGSFYFFLCGQNFLFLIFSILAFYSKGFVAIALIGLVVGADLIMDKKFKKLGGLIVAGLALFAVMVGPWVYGLWKSGGAEYLRVFFIENNFHRFVSSRADHSDTPVYLYAFSFLGDFLPWTFLALAAFPSFFVKNRFWRLDPPRRFLCFWFALMFLFLSASSSRRSIYLLPAFPAAALLAAVWLEKAIQNPPLAILEKSMVLLTMGLLTVAGLGLFGADVVRHKVIFIPLLGIAVTAYASFLIWTNFKRRNTFYVVIGFFFITALVLVSADGIFIGDLERKNTFLPFIEAAKQKLEGRALAGYDLSEMERGVFSFYLERTVPNLQSTDQLARFMTVNKGRPVLLMANRNHLKIVEETVKNDLNIIYRYRPDEKTRSYLLFASRDNI